MLNLIPQPEFEPRPQAYAEAVSRLATIRHALRLVDGGFSAGPADDGVIAGAWDQAGEARQRWFDKRSERLVGATAAGVEALVTERQDGREPHVLANQTLVDQIRRELQEIAGVVLR